MTENISSSLSESLGYQPQHVNYVVVGIPKNRISATEQADILISMVTTDRAVAENKAKRENAIEESRYEFAVFSQPVVTRQDIIEKELLQPIIDKLQRFIDEHPYITETELNEVIEKLVFSDKIDNLIN